MQFNLPSLKNAGDIRGKRVFLAVDLNLSIVENKIVDTYRIEQNRETLDFLRANGARTLLVSHRTDESATLRPVFEYLKTQYPVMFAETLGEANSAMEKAPAGSFVLLENIRKVGGDREKKNEPAFARELAELADVYVNEAFSISHRPHASIVGVPKLLPHFAGFLFEKEVEHLSKAFEPPHPFLFIIGGAKFDTKFPLVKKFALGADFVFVAGALANDIFKAKGLSVGVSAVSSGEIPLRELLSAKNVFIPIDVVVQTPAGAVVKKPNEVLDEERIVDAGPETITFIANLLKQSKFVLWNGPFGDYEKGFAEGTKELARAITASSAESIIGGGDTVAVLSKLEMFSKFSFVSSAGGAMLDFLANETLPGIEALEKASS